MKINGDLIIEGTSKTLNDLVTGDNYISEFHLSPISGTIPALSWQIMYSDFITPIIPKGTYLIIFNSHYSSGGTANLGVLTTNIVIDNYSLVLERESNPLGLALTYNSNVATIRTFDADSVHTLNARAYASGTYLVTYGKYTFVKLF